MHDTKLKIKPYNSPVIPALGVARCSVTFGGRSTPVLWYIIDDNCEPVLSGPKAEQLGIITFQKKPEVFKPINMIHGECKKAAVQDILKEYPSAFTGIGKMKDYAVKLHVNNDVKPVVAHQRPIPYHLKQRVNDVIDEMVKNDIIEEHPVGQSSPWISNVAIAPKADGEIRLTLDSKKVNAAIHSSNLPIPRQEDIKAKMANCKIF